MSCPGTFLTSFHPYSWLFEPSLGQKHTFTHKGYGFPEKWANCMTTLAKLRGMTQEGLNCEQGCWAQRTCFPNSWCWPMGCREVRSHCWEAATWHLPMPGLPSWLAMGEPRQIEQPYPEAGWGWGRVLVWCIWSLSYLSCSSYSVSGLSPNYKPSMRLCPD